MLAMVPTTFAIPSLLAILVSSSLVKKHMNSNNQIQTRTLRDMNDDEYLKAEAKMKVIAGTEFCIAETKVGLA